MLQVQNKKELIAALREQKAEFKNQLRTLEAAATACFHDHNEWLRVQSQIRITRGKYTVAQTKITNLENGNPILGLVGVAPQSASMSQSFHNLTVNK